MPQKNQQIDATLKQFSPEQKDGALKAAHEAAMRTLGLSTDGPLKVSALVFDHSTVPAEKFFKDLSSDCFRDQLGNCRAWGGPLPGKNE